VDLKDRGIRVNVLSPGPIDTAAMQRLPDGAKDQFKAIIPRGELGRPRGDRHSGAVSGFN